MCSLCTLVYAVFVGRILHIILLDSQKIDSFKSLVVIGSFMLGKDAG